MEKNCIIFDNEDQSAEIEKLKRDAANKGLNINCEQFNVGSTSMTELLTNGEIDIEKVSSEFKRKFKGKVFHLAVFDWNLDDDNIDGIELIRQLNHRKILTRTPKIVISGLLKEILNDIVTSDENRRIEKLSTLVKNDIKGYYDRDKYENDIIQFFQKTEESLDLIIDEELNRFPEHRFNNSFVNNNFKGKTFAEISEYLESDLNIRNEFKKEITQQVIAYLTQKI